MALRGPNLDLRVLRNQQKKRSRTPSTRTTRKRRRKTPRPPPPKRTSRKRKKFHRGNSSCAPRTVWRVQRPTRSKVQRKRHRKRNLPSRRVKTVINLHTRTTIYYHHYYYKE